MDFDELSPLTAGIEKRDVLVLMKKHGLVSLDADVAFLDTPEGAQLANFAQAVFNLGASQCRGGTPPDVVALPTEIPMTAAAWDLYAGHADVEDVARTLGNMLRSKLDEAKAVGQCDLAAARRIRNEMYREMNKYARLGARDSEPEVILVTAIERVLGLPYGELER